MATREQGAALRTKREPLCPPTRSIPGWDSALAGAWIPAMIAPVGMRTAEWSTAKPIEYPYATIWVGLGRLRPGYGLREAATVLVYAVRRAVPLRLRTDLALVPAGTSANAARSLVESD